MLPLYATIDTNVIVSAMINPNSTPGLIIKYIKENYIIPLVNEEILYEYIEVLKRDKFNFSNDKIFETIFLFLKKGKMVKPLFLVSLKDKTDEIFFNITLSYCNNDSYLITGNQNTFLQNLE